MDAERLRPLLEGERPYASIYFEDSHDTEDAAAQLELRWRGLHHELTEQGADTAVIDEMRRAVAELPAPVGQSGRAVIADATGVLLNEHLIRPTPTVVRVSPLPYLVPMVEHGYDSPAYLLVEADHRGAELTVYRHGRVHAETVDGAGYPVHKAAGAENAGYKDPQPRSEEAARKNIRTIAVRVTELIDDQTTGPVFVVGEVQARHDLTAELPDRVADRVVALTVGARDSGYDPDEIRDRIDAELLTRRLAHIDAATRRFSAEVDRPSAVAVEGLGPVCSALNHGAVETLIVGEIGAATVVTDAGFTVVAAGPDALSEYGAEPAHTVRADEALPTGAVAVDAAVVRTDERISPADGVAALLRYPVASGPDAP
ncbi:hypothetical protein H7J77_08245 [Mycolicibacillus parakoreensis]|uniref:Peptide chain release factor 1 n=1 Tax=Mycolicibacillus parakoreensis TaxID=1069221 RepID=A0ABY3U098_9MYCO|nr:hypothetical protein [Mycolicibacillus parakoreensis]MCV7315529.1 hypothetical protein [Mycolicibacillus parakoreensis]ULN52020.1 hypothetical protein MIU77_14250 [Mycolicibacillus parakoreensis]